MSLFGIGSKSGRKTFRARKSSYGNKGLQLRQYIDATLGRGDLSEAVKLPIGEDLHEWLAVNTIDFYNHTNLLYGTLTEFCTPASCPFMSAGPRYEYRWADGVAIKKPLQVSAPKYVEFLVDWVEVQLDNGEIFPPQMGGQFPPNFKQAMKTILKRLFRVYAHIYHSHYQKIVSLEEERHLNACFKHFVLFIVEFGLIEKPELEPLREIIHPILQGLPVTSSSSSYIICKESLSFIPLRVFMVCGTRFYENFFQCKTNAFLVFFLP